MSVSSTPGWLKPLKERAQERFNVLGFPTTGMEEWKYTNVSSLSKIPFRAVERAEIQTVSPSTLESILVADKAKRLVWVDGHYSPELSSLGDLPNGIIVESLALAWNSHRSLVEPHLGKYANSEEFAFAALNTAALTDGAFVYLPKGAVFEEPLYFIFISSNEGTSTKCISPRILVIAEENAEATIIEDHVTVGKEGSFTNAVTEIVVGENSTINHYKIQRENDRSFHLSTTEVRQKANSRFHSYSFSLGASLTRNDLNVLLGAENAETVLHGLFLADSGQHTDNHTRIDHAKPHCRSFESYKGILDGKATGVFNGKVLVRKDAQKTDAVQNNRNLLLSDTAEIDTKPQLEIYADDVKCTHGATVGQLDDNSIFYLRSRGMDEKEAKALLTFAFANEVVREVKFPELKSGLSEIVAAKLKGGSAR